MLNWVSKMTQYIKFQGIIKQTEKAVCLEKWQGGIVWLPKKCIKPNYSYTKGVSYYIPDWLCEEKGLQGKTVELFHKPEKIEPEFNQEAIDELKY